LNKIHAARRGSLRIVNVKTLSSVCQRLALKGKLQEKNMATSVGSFVRVVGALACLSLPVAACPSEGLVLGAGKAFTSAARSGSASAFTNAASRYADTRGIALSALGSHRKKLTKAQEAEYLRLAQSFMGEFMARYSNRFNASGMKITTCRGNVVTATTSSGKKIMFRVGGGRLQDVNVSSVWLAGQMRSAISGVLNRNGGDVQALFRYLRS
jgi:ABC-type transporter MlaC component